MVYIRGTPLVEWFRGKVREKREKRLRQFRVRVNGWNEAIIMNLNLDWAKLTWWMLRVFGQARGWSLIVRECTISLQIVEVQRNIMCDLWFAGGLFWLKHQGNDWQLGLAPSPTHTFTHATLMHHMRLYIHTFSQANSELHYVALILSINSFISFFSLPPCRRDGIFLWCTTFFPSCQVCVSSWLHLPFPSLFSFYPIVTYSQFFNHCFQLIC